MTILIRARPFNEYLEREQGLPMLEFRGAIEGNAFVVTVLGQRVELDTAEVGEDKYGRYAVLRECLRDLRDGFKLRLELDPEEDGLHGGCLHLYLEGAHKEEAVRLLREQGVDPERVQLIGSNERSFALYFDHWGKVNGSGASYRGRFPGKLEA